MRLGSSFPITDLGTDAGVIKSYAQGLEDIGYHEIYLGEHVLGFDHDAHRNWKPYNPTVRASAGALYDYRFPFLEPLVTFGFLAGVTRTLRLASYVMVLGMRQAVLVAKQAAIADVLSGGRITLGVGSGWNDLEYQAMSVDFASRGKRVEEQIAVMRALWTEDVVRFHGTWHTIDAAGINPLPVQRPIPIWIGGVSAPATIRAARIAEGWVPNRMFESSNLSSWGESALTLFRSSAREAGRDPQTLSLVGSVTVGTRMAEEVVEELEQWHGIGATHVNVRTAAYPPTAPGRGAGRQPPGPDVDEHLAVLSEIFAAWRDRHGDQ
jgi:probable F420-dependent oxidoreductase